MSLFNKKEDHPGSGIDKPQPKGLVEKVVDKVKAVVPAPAPKSNPAP